MSLPRNFHGNLRNDELQVGELVDVEDDPRGVAEKEDEDDAEQDETQVELPPLPPRRPEALHLGVQLEAIV